MGGGKLSREFPGPAIGPYTLHDVAPFYDSLYGP